MRFPPLSVIESWPIPNYVDPPVQKPYLIPLLAILTFAATCMVILRLYTRISHKRAGIDDWLVAVAIIPGIAYTISISIGVTHYFWDRHVWDIPPGPGNINEVKERLISWVTQMLYVWCANLTKMSLLFFYRRAFTTPKMQKVVIGVLIFTVAYLLTCVLLLCLECNPTNYYWEEMRSPPPTHGSCIDEGTHLMASSVMNVVLDTIILLLPVRTVLSLHIILSQKLQILSIFAAGILVVVCGAIRAYMLWITTEVTFDVTWRGYNAFLFTGIEMYVGLICACLPACRGILKQWRESTRHTNQTPNTADTKSFSTTIDSTRASMPPANGIKKRTKTTIDVQYRRMDHPPIPENPSHQSLGICSPLPILGNKELGTNSKGHSNVWGAEGGATNVTRAWAGRRMERGRRGSEGIERIELEKLVVKGIGEGERAKECSRDERSRGTFYEDESSSVPSSKEDDDGVEGRSSRSTV